MFRIATTKVKIAAGLAAGALTLGAAGAYAANAAAQNTVPVKGSATLTANGQTLTLSTVSSSPKAFPTTPFKNEGQCIAWFASNRDYAPMTTATTVRKNYHGKLMSTIKSFCSHDVTATTKSETADNVASDGTESDTTDSSDTTDLQSGASNGHGHGHGHGASNLD